MNNPILQFAPYLTFAIVFLILLEIPLCLSDWHTDCGTQFICGNTEASFPFWGNQRPYGCGIPELELKCANDKTSLRLNNVTYRVLQLNQATRILNIAREDFMNGFCPPNFVNTTLDHDLFEYIPGYTNLTFVYGCPTSLMPSSLLFNCNVNGPLFEIGLVQPGATGPGLCYSSVYVPVSVSLAAVLNLSALKNDLQKGFEVRWKIDDTECNNCISSKGACGYDLTSNQTTCYCRGQSSGSTTCSASSSSPDSKPAAKARFPTAITITASVIGSVMLFCIGYCLIKRVARMKHGKTMLRREKNQKRVKFRGRRYQIEALELRAEPDGSEMITVECLQFDLGAIESATKKFSAENKLGRGGFGEVYKGTLPNGQEIAVKRLLRSSAQGAEEFKNEVLLVAKLQHRNLTRLLGFCLEGEETILIYEYVPNRSLDYFLFNPKMQGHLDWSTRQKIIGGIARGILYLHEDSLLKIIHRDLKAGNILLDKNMNPKISDFGLARLFGVDQIEASTNRIVGT